MCLNKGKEFFSFGFAIFIKKQKYDFDNFLAQHKALH